MHRETPPVGTNLLDQEKFKGSEIHLGLKRLFERDVQFEKLNTEIKNELLEFIELLSQRLLVVGVEYLDAHGVLRSGHVLVDKSMAAPLSETLLQLKHSGFNIQQFRPLQELSFNDDESMEQNFSSSFNFRFVEGISQFSLHAIGLGVDLNPMQNPQIKDSATTPPKASYNPKAAGTITPEIAQTAKAQGFEWGGDWTSLKDYMHFQMPPRKLLEDAKSKLVEQQKKTNSSQNSLHELEAEVAYWSKVVDLQDRRLVAGS